MNQISILLLTVLNILLSLFAVNAQADDVLWNCQGADKGLYRVSTTDRSSNVVTVTKIAKGAEDVKQDGVYQSVAQLFSAFIQVTSGDRTVLLAGYEPRLGAMTGFVQIAPEQPKVAVRCPLNN